MGEGRTARVEIAVLAVVVGIDLVYLPTVVGALVRCVGNWSCSASGPKVQAQGQGQGQIMRQGYQRAGKAAQSQHQAGMRFRFMPRILPWRRSPRRRLSWKRIQMRREKGGQLPREQRMGLCAPVPGKLQLLLLMLLPGVAHHLDTPVASYPAAQAQAMV